MNFARALGFGADLAIDLGTANTCVFAPGRGVVLTEPSVVAFSAARDKVEAIGTEAKEMLGRTPGSVVAIKPLRDGVIADFEAAEKMLAYFVRKAHRRSAWVRPRVIIGVPADITPVERRAVRESALRAKASEVYLVDEALAAAVGTGMPVTEPTGNMIVDVGGGTTDIAVISLGGLVYSRSVRVAGNEMDEAIMAYMRRRHGLLIGERTAEHIKITLGSAAPLEEPLTIEVRGRHLTEGIPRTVDVSDGEIREALTETVNVIVRAVRDALERVPPELSSDICDRGIVLTGGGAMLKHFDRRLRDETHLPVTLAEEPLASVAVGAGALLGDAKLLGRLAA